MKSTFKVLFYLKKGSEKKNGEVMIMARITIDGKLCQFSTKQSILPENWNIAAGKAKGKDAGKINALLEDIKASLNNIYHEQQRRDNYVTAEKVKNEFLGHSEKHETILNLFKKHNDDVKQLVGISKTIASEIISFIKSSSICGFPPLCFAISLQFNKVCDFGYQFFHVAALYQPFVRREQRRTEHGFTLCVQFLFKPFGVRDKYFHKG